MHPAASILPSQGFDLEATLDCGQVFHWRREGAGWLGVIGETPVHITQHGDALHVSPGAEQAVARYLALDHPMQEIAATFPAADPHLAAALRFCGGLRLVRQPLWECLATFITSAMKQVAHIAQISHTLRSRYGRAVSLGAHTLHAYPTVETIAALDEAALRDCALGFRAKNLLATARLIADGRVDLGKLAQLDDAAARAVLESLPGVGPKIAHCVLLFGCERLASFPIDVWVERILRRLYFPRRRKFKAQELAKFAHDYFGPYAGYAQQYLFHYARSHWPRGD